VPQIGKLKPSVGNTPADFTLADTSYERDAVPSPGTESPTVNAEDVETPTVTDTRSNRQSRLPGKYNDFVMY
jgi:hypothetical protein